MRRALKPLIQLNNFKIYRTGSVVRKPPASKNPTHFEKHFMACYVRRAEKPRLAQLRRALLLRDAQRADALMDWECKEGLLAALGAPGVRRCRAWLSGSLLRIFAADQNYFDSCRRLLNKR